MRTYITLKDIETGQLLPCAGIWLDHGDLSLGLAEDEAKRINKKEEQVKVVKAYITEITE